MNKREWLRIVGFMAMGVFAWAHGSMKINERFGKPTLDREMNSQAAIEQRVQNQNAPLGQRIRKATGNLGALMVQHSIQKEQTVAEKKGVQRVVQNVVIKAEKGVGKTLMKGESMVVALILWFFLGGLAIHRVYLGTTPLMILWYFLTFGGIFGLCPLFDLITMIVNFDAMIDNNKFFSIAAL